MTKTIFLLLVLSMTVATHVSGQWTSDPNQVHLNGSNDDKIVSIYNPDVLSPTFYGGGKLRVADDATNASFGDVVAFHGLRMRTNDRILRLNFTRFLQENENLVLIQGTENLTDQKFRIDTEGDAFFEGSLRLLDLGYDGTSSTAVRVRGDETIWYDGTAFSWGFGGEYNRFADPMIFGSSGAPVSGVQVRIDQGNLQLEDVGVFIDDTNDGKVVFRSSEGDLLKSTIVSASNYLQMDDLSNLRFSVNGQEELGIREGEVQLSGDLDVNFDSRINFHGDGLFDTPRISLRRESDGTFRIDNVDQSKELLITTQGGEIQLNNSIGAIIALDSGYVGINEKNPEHTLHVEGNAAVTGEFLVLSDRREKKDIVPLQNLIDKICQLEPSEYNWKSKPNHSIGVIAQDVEQIFPDLVNTSKSGMKMVNYQALSVLAIQGIKEQKEKIDHLESIINQIVADVELLKKKR